MRSLGRSVHLPFGPIGLAAVAMLILPACHATAPAGVTQWPRRTPPPAGLLEAAASLVEYRWEVAGPPTSARFIDPAQRTPIALSDSVVLDMAGIDSASVWRTIRDTTSGWDVLVRLSRSGAASFGATTATHVGQRLAVIVDGRVTDLPQVNSALGSTAPLASNVSRHVADSLAARVNTMVVALRPFLPVLLH